MRAMYARFMDRKGAVLRQLSDSGELVGLALVKGSDSVLTRMTIYTLLAQMEDKGLISSRYMDGFATAGKVRRRVYCITDVGREVLAESAHA